ncbi:DNA primase [Oceanicaulis alexandrii]|uniref:DNA primase n=1 Tax=Oceanicaulis alexandrii TaxID=153233 RepID=UPI002357159C|nr:DNA primase [Oceanicaulis alexandrii]
MAIPDGFKDEIKTRIRPSELIGRTVPLKRQGREFVGLSPFKKERTPSFFVNDEKGFYHCFASQEHGDIFTWLQKTQGLSFMEAIEALAQEAGLEVPRMEQRDPQQEQHRKTLLDWIALAQEYFTRSLYAPEGEEARLYLERRGLSRSDMERFGLGFAPDNRRGLTRALIQKGASAQDLSDAGLSILPDDGGEPYDRFRGRVMFPIKDARDRLVAFGGRAMSKDVRAKYLNSPETELFHKGSLLYRYPEARAFAHDPKVKAKGLIVAEGYMDVIAFARAGLGQAVAPLGTALTENQLRLLWRAGPEPVVCLDGDAAGTRAAALAAERALELLEPGRTLRFVFLPDGQDPDDLLRERGAQALKDAIDDAKPLIDVLWRREVELEPLDDPDRRAGFRKRIKALVAKINDPDIKAEYRAEFDVRIDAQFGRTPQAGFRPDRNRGGYTGRGAGRRFMPLQPPTAELVAQRKHKSPSAPLRQLLLAVIEHPEIAEAEAETLLQISFGTLDSLRDAILDACFSGESLPVGGLRDALSRRGFGPQLTRLAVDKAPMRASLGESEADADSRLEAWRRLSASYMERVAQDAQDRPRHADFFEEGDSDALKNYLVAERRGRQR